MNSYGLDSSCRKEDMMKTRSANPAQWRIGKQTIRRTGRKACACFLAASMTVMLAVPYSVAFADDVESASADVESVDTISTATSTDTASIELAATSDAESSTQISTQGSLPAPTIGGSATVVAQTSGTSVSLSITPPAVTDVPSGVESLCVLCNILIERTDGSSGTAPASPAMRVETIAITGNETVTPSTCAATINSLEPGVSYTIKITTSCWYRNTSSGQMVDGDVADSPTTSLQVQAGSFPSPIVGTPEVSSVVDGTSVTFTINPAPITVPSDAVVDKLGSFYSVRVTSPEEATSPAIPSQKLHIIDVSPGQTVTPESYTMTLDNLDPGTTYTFEIKTYAWYMSGSVYGEESVSGVATQTITTASSGGSTSTSTPTSTSTSSSSTSNTPKTADSTSVLPEILLLLSGTALLIAGFGVHLTRRRNRSNR